MLSPTIEKALNDQIHHEMTNAYTYLGYSAWFAERNLPGFAHWMMIQRSEELVHAMKLFQFVIDRGGRVVLQDVQKPVVEFAGTKDVFAATLRTEEGTTARVNALYHMASDEKDFATMSHLQWYIDEQVEEEKTVSEVLAKLEMAGESKGTLLHLDHQMEKRGK